MKEHPEYKYRPRRKPKPMMKKEGGGGGNGAATTPSSASSAASRAEQVNHHHKFSSNSSTGPPTASPAAPAPFPLHHFFPPGFDPAASVALARTLFQPFAAAAAANAAAAAAAAASTSPALPEAAKISSNPFLPPHLLSQPSVSLDLLDHPKRAKREEDAREE